MKRIFLLFAALHCSLIVPVFALAHPTPSSITYLDFTIDGVIIEHDVPIEELQRAQLRRLLEEDQSPTRMLLREGSSLRGWLVLRIHPLARTIYAAACRKEEMLGALLIAYSAAGVSMRTNE